MHLKMPIEAWAQELLGAGRPEESARRHLVSIFCFGRPEEGGFDGFCDMWDLLS